MKSKSNNKSYSANVSLSKQLSLFAHKFFCLRNAWGSDRCSVLAWLKTGVENLIKSVTVYGCLEVFHVKF